jgi:hypothetical protein
MRYRKTPKGLLSKDSFVATELFNNYLMFFSDPWQWERARNNCKWIILFGSTGSCYVLSELPDIKSWSESIPLKFFVFSLTKVHDADINSSQAILLRFIILPTCIIFFCSLYIIPFNFPFLTVFLSYFPFFHLFQIT